MFRRVARISLLAALGLASCGGTPPAAKSAPAPAVVGTTFPSSLRAPAHPANTRVVPSRSHQFATLARKGVGPFLAHVRDASLAAWIAPAEKTDQHDLIVAALAGDGAPLAQVRVVAHVPREATSLVVEPAGGPSDGWLLVWTALLDRGESVSVLGLTPDGTPRGDPSDLQRTADHVSWAGLVPTSHGAICLWAEETAAGSANMLSVPIGADGKPRGLPMRIATGVERWQAVRAGSGAALALARAEAHVESGPATAATVSWQMLDADGHPHGSAVVIARNAALDSDVDVTPANVAAPVGQEPRDEKWLLAWTDRTAQDAQVVLATIDRAGHVEGPVPAMNEVGASALVALASGPGGIALAWQEPGRRTRENRTLHLSLVTTAGRPAAEPLTAIEIAPETTPELVGTDSGFAVLGAARACEAASGVCAQPLMPVFVRFGGRLEPVQTEPLFVGPERDPATIAWSLHCGSDHEGKREQCLALAATGDSPTPVFTVDLAPRESPFIPPLPPLPPADTPRITGISTVTSGERYDDIAVASLGEMNLVGTLTGAAGAPHSSRHRSRMGTIVLRSVDAAGQRLAPPTTLSSRALPVGGLALAPGGQPDDGAAVAWVGLDGGDPHVFVARVDAKGHKIRQLRLTSDATNASNVALAWTGDGWLAAWADARDGNGDIFVAKVDRSLRRDGRDERIRHAVGDATDIALAVHGASAWIAWSDPRDSPREGIGDIFVTTLHPSDGTRAGDEYRVLATARHSRSPALAPLEGGGALIAWIEDAPTGLEGPSAAMVARLDPGAHVIASPVEIALASGGRPTAIAFVPAAGKADESVSAIVGRAAAGGVTLDSVHLRPDGTPLTRAWPLLDLDAPPGFDVTFAVTMDGLMFEDVGAGPTDRRVRRAAVRWPR